MSGVGFYASTPEVALVADTAKTVIEITAAANHRVLLTDIGFFFDGVSGAQQPVLIELIRITTTGTGSALTLHKRDPSHDETLEVSAKHIMTVEPTGITTIRYWNVHPQSGYEVICPLGKEIILPGGALIGIRMTAPGTGVNVATFIEGEE